MECAQPFAWIVLVVERLAIETDAIGRPTGLLEKTIDGVEAVAVCLRLERIGTLVEDERSLDVVLSFE